MKRLLFLSLFFLIFAFGQESTTIDFTLNDINGEPVSLKDCLKTGPVYISFWALWCEPCKSELRVLQPLYETYKEKGITILAINCDTPKSLAKVKTYVATKKFSFLVLVDPDACVFEKLNGNNLPYTLLINKEGRIVKTRNRFLPGDKSDIEKDFIDILAPPNPKE
jgi:cytochrome c biogenesis protein CcmG, thiol:disulfide interchange protein DsbE